MIKSEPVNRFYLSKGEKTIFIDNVNIPQNYLEGLRFLYRSFSKKKPGIILNDDSNVNRNSQIVLFLKAVQLLINKTILIVCPEDAEQVWMSLFHQWTEFNEDVVIETEKPYLRKKVIINPSQDLHNFCSREWGMIIVDDDQTMLDMLRYPFKADFKIWSSPTKMTENLNIFSEIYKWLYPKSKFNEKDFLSDKRNPCDVVDKAILLDAFLEDVVLRREDGSNEEQAQVSEKPKVSRKNKDATGTKIKRSKPKPCEDVASVKVTKLIEEAKNGDRNVESAITRVVEDVTQNISITMDDGINDDECPIMNYKKKKDIIEDYKVNKHEHETQSELNLYYESTENSDRIYEMNTLPLDNEDFNDESRNNEVNDIETNVNNEIRTENNVVHENTYKKINKVETTNTESNEIEIMNTEPNEIETMNTESNEIETINTESNENRETTEIKSKRTHFDDEITNEISNNHDLDSKNNSIVHSPSLKMEIDENLNSNADVGLSKVNKLDDTIVPVTNTLKRGIEDRMKEMEERALKKFKGSILDSLF